MQLSGVLVGDACKPVDQLPVELRAKLDGRAVRAHDDDIAVDDPAARSVPGRELDLASRPLEVELRHALDSGPGEERPVALQAELSASGDRLGSGRRRGL